MPMKLPTVVLFSLLVLTATLAGAEPLAQPQSPLPRVWRLEEAVRFALANNPDSLVGQQRIEGARAAIAMERSAFYPNLSLNSRYGQTNAPMYSFGNILNQGAFTPTIDFNNPGRTDNLHLGVEVGYRLFNGWRDQAGLDGARARETASRMELATVRSQLAFEVVRAFNLIVQAEAMVQSHGAMVSAMDESIRTARVRQQEGLLLASELLDLEVQQAVSRENLSQARHNLALARRVFLNLLGLKEGSGEVSSEGIDAQEMPQPLAAGKRPELLGMEAMLLGAEARVRQARGGNYPAIDGYAGYGTDSGLVTDEAGDSWELGVRLRYNLFDGHRTSAEVGAARAMLAELREQKRKTELAISLEVERATLALTDAEERLRVSEKTVAAAQESARVNRARFKEGLVLAADMIGVETRLTEAMLRRAVNDAARRVAIADLRRAMGLSQFREQPEPPPTTTTP